MSSHFPNRILSIILLLVALGCSKAKRSENAGIKMQDFVIHISEYARKISPAFKIIPQNGAELAFKTMDSENEFNQKYLNAIDAFSVEELFYNGNYTPDNERINILRKLKPQKPLLVSESVNDNTLIPAAMAANLTEGFVPFVRNATNYNYTQIPDSVPNKNSMDIVSVSDAKNFLYLISTENYSDKLTFLNDIKKTDFDLVLIDLFFDDNSFTPEEINTLKTKMNGGKRLVICYMDIGSAEKYRYYWKKSWGLHNPYWIRKKYEGYPDEFWVNFWKSSWQKIIYGNDESYTKKILDAGFDGVFLDNVEAYYFLYYNG